MGASAIPLSLVCLFQLVATSDAAAPSSVINATVDSGVLSIPSLNVSQSIGFSFSSINSVIQTYFAPLSPPSARSGPALLNSAAGVFSYLTLANGSYSADAPLALLPQLILVLDSVEISPTAAFAEARAWGGLIELNASHYAGVVSPARTAST